MNAPSADLVIKKFRSPDDIVRAPVHQPGECPIQKTFLRNPVVCSGQQRSQSVSAMRRTKEMITKIRWAFHTNVFSDSTLSIFIFFIRAGSPTSPEFESKTLLIKMKAAGKEKAIVMEDGSTSFDIRCTMRHGTEVQAK